MLIGCVCPHITTTSILFLSNSFLGQSGLDSLRGQRLDVEQYSSSWFGFSVYCSETLLAVSSPHIWFSSSTRQNHKEVPFVTMEPWCYFDNFKNSCFNSPACWSLWPQQLNSAPFVFIKKKLSLSFFSERTQCTNVFLILYHCDYNENATFGCWAACCVLNFTQLILTLIFNSVCSRSSFHNNTVSVLIRLFCLWTSTRLFCFLHCHLWHIHGHGRLNYTSACSNHPRYETKSTKSNVLLGCFPQSLCVSLNALKLSSTCLALFVSSWRCNFQHFPQCLGPFIKALHRRRSYFSDDQPFFPGINFTLGENPERNKEAG